MMDEVAAGVSHYYERNVNRFLRFGGSGEVAAIHRKIWAPGVRDSAQAFLYLNRLVLRQISSVIGERNAHVLDLGCGVGGTATWVAQHASVQVTGIADGTKQVRIAQARAKHLGLAGQCRFLQQDFLNLSPLGPVQAAFAIESFVHARSVPRFFESVSNVLTPGGRLVICDDFLASPEANLDSEGGRLLDLFTKGWHISSLLPVSEVERLAARNGFRIIDTIDLTSYIRAYPEFLLAGMLALGNLPIEHPAVENFVGGAALQKCILKGITQYLVITLEKG